MVQIKKFGELDGKEISLITLSEENGISVDFINYGATIRAINVPAKDGKMVDVCLGFDDVEGYVKDNASIGVCVGRYANRIGGAKFTLNDIEYILNANEGKNQLHGGKIGFSKKIWDFETTDNSVTFSTFSPHLEEGFPGNLNVKTTYTVKNGGIEIEYYAKSDMDTIVNLTNHSYFNLSGHGSGKIDDHVLKFKSRFYCVNDEESIPTGEILAVKGTLYDFNEETRLGDRIYDKSVNIDINYVIDDLYNNEPAATIYSPLTGIKMDTYTDKPGMQIYCASALYDGVGKNNSPFSAYHGVCLESQYYPNSPNFSHFPSPTLKANEEYKSKTSYIFGLKD